MRVYYKYDPITRRYAGTEESVGCPVYATEVQPHREDAVFDLISREWKDPPEPPQPSVQEIIKQYTDAVQARLDSFARTRGYDSVLSCTSYANSTNPKFAAEAQYMIQARDNTWTTCYQILNEVMSGTREIPTLDELMNELPPLAWPDNT